jgi:hypothetical protein
MLGVMGVLLVCVLILTVCAPRVLVATQVFFHLNNFFAITFYSNAQKINYLYFQKVF